MAPSWEAEWWAALSLEAELLAVPASRARQRSLSYPTQRCSATKSGVQRWWLRSVALDCG